MTTRRSVLTGVAAAAVAAATGCAPRSAGPELILHNAMVVTMDDAAPTAQAVAVSNERIVAVGSNSAMLALRGTRTRVADLGGRTLLPGFNDAHGHWIGDRDMTWGAPGPVHPAQPTVEAAIESALQCGWTSLTEMFVTADRLDELLAVDRTTGLGLRVNAYLPVNYLADHDHYGIWFDGYRPNHEYSSRLRLAGAKLFIDRARPSLMYLSEPHSDDGTYGEVYWTQDQLTDMVTALVGRGWQIAAHSVGDGAHDLMLNAIRAAGSPRRARLEHLVALRDDQISVIRGLGIIASIQFTWLTSDWLVLEELKTVADTLGAARLGWAGRWRDLIDAGVSMAGGTDAPHTGATPLQAIHQAVTRIGYAGQPPTDWMLAQRITVAEALRLLTAGAAYATFQEGVKGRIREGMLADFVVLSENPLTVPVEHIPDITVAATLVGGRVRYCPSAVGDLCL
jgi:predicted amidohydrolase YtcJ